jgi:lycopene beta-cyclase
MSGHERTDLAQVAGEVVVVGDGPAGSALAQALLQHDVDVVLIGPDAPWSATYGTWADDLEQAEVLHGGDIWLHRFDSIAARFNALRTIRRPYGVVDNDRLRTLLRAGVDHRRATPPSTEFPHARLVIDATGWPSKLTDGDHAARDDHHQVAWQTAYGVVLSEPPDGPLGSPMMMDFSDSPGESLSGGVPTFAYALPVRDGWLVEETVLAAAPAIDPNRLAARLAGRLGVSTAQLDRQALRVEHVRIPMGAPARRTARNGAVMTFGAAAGMIHPATGYSIAAALRAAVPVAERIADLLRTHRTASGLRADQARLATIVWSDAALRTRSLHEYGLNVLKQMDGNGVRAFFDAFFDSKPNLWEPYLRIDATPNEVARLMASMFQRADWKLRRQLLKSNPLLLARALR